MPVTSQYQGERAQKQVEKLGFRSFFFPMAAIILAAAEDHPALRAYFRITLGR